MTDRPPSEKPTAEHSPAVTPDLQAGGDPAAADAIFADELFPREGRLAAVDYGTVRIGVAICDPGRILVSPLAIHTRTGEAQLTKFFTELAAEERVAAWVVGLPIHCDGGESQKSGEAREFALWLQQTTSLPTRLFDERFSTAQAKRRLRGRKMTHKTRQARIDAVAAQVLLEAFLEVQQYTGKLPGQAADAPPDGDDALE